MKAVRGECSTTQDQINRLSSVEQLQIAAGGALATLNGEESGALTLLNSARRQLEIAKEKDSKLGALADQVNESLYILDDAVRELASYESSLEADPSLLDSLQSRKAALASFIKRYGSEGDPDEELVALADRAKSAKESLADLQAGDSRITEIESELKTSKSALLDAAKKLSNSRRSTATKLASEVTREIKALAMQHTEFFLEVSSPDYLAPLKESDFTALGCDEVAMLLRGQSDGTKITLGKGASGGEMSRIMLALEVVIAQSHPVGTYIFDEVDAGVGGKAAIEVGKRLHALAQSAQVIVVTHLPQVAAWGDTHFMVKKSSDGSVVASGVARLEHETRIEEIARMLAGLEESVSAREHAAELLALRG